MEKNLFLEMFNQKKPIIGMIHLKGNSNKDIFITAKKEIKLLTDNDVDAVLIENYYGNDRNVEEVLDYLSCKDKKVLYGVNILHNYKLAFYLANKYDAHFIQVDSIAGHLDTQEDKLFDREIRSLRTNSKAFLIGGVRFKYQPYLSGRSIGEDLRIGMDRCDGIVVTGQGTGRETNLKKIKEFRNIIKDFPLIVGAGLTDDNCYDQLSIADAGIVGSYFKKFHQAEEDVSLTNVNLFMDKVKTLRR